MSNVIIGIIGVMLFVGLALAGASYFGPVVQDSVQEGRASGTLQAMSDIAHSVSARNRELETVTLAGADASILVPDYLDRVPTNPTNGAAIALLGANGAVGGTPARIVATRLEGDRPAGCRFLSRSGGGADAVQDAAGPSARRSGCFRASAAYGPFSSGDLVGFVRIG